MSDALKRELKDMPAIQLIQLLQYVSGLLANSSSFDNDRALSANVIDPNWEMNSSICYELSEQSLSDWNDPREDEAWKDFQ
jgi:hypothetical protein